VSHRLVYCFGYRGLLQIGNPKDDFNTDISSFLKDVSFWSQKYRDTIFPKFQTEKQFSYLPFGQINNQTIIFLTLISTTFPVIYEAVTLSTLWNYFHNPANFNTILRIIDNFSDHNIMQQSYKCANFPYDKVEL
jgi:hypothetical protein